MNLEEKIGILEQLIQKEKSDAKKKKYAKLLVWLKSQLNKTTRGSLRYGDFSRRFNKTQIEDETKTLLKKSQNRTITDDLSESIKRHENELQQKKAQYDAVHLKLDKAKQDGDNVLVEQLQKQEQVIVEKAKEQSATVKLGKSPLVQFFLQHPDLKPDKLPKSLKGLTQANINNINKQIEKLSKGVTTTIAQIAQSLTKAGLTIKEGEVVSAKGKKPIKLDLDVKPDESESDSNDDEQKESDSDNVDESLYFSGDDESPPIFSPPPKSSSSASAHAGSNLGLGSKHSHEEAMANELANVIRKYFQDQRPRMNAYDAQNAKIQSIVKQKEKQAIHRIHEDEHVNAEIRMRELQQKQQAYYQLYYDELVRNLKDRLEKEVLDKKKNSP